MADNNAPFDPGPNQPTNPQVGNGPNTPAGPNFNRHTGTFLAPNNPGPLPPSRQSPPTWQSPPFIGTPPTSLFQDLSGDSLAVAEHDTIIDDCMRSVTVDDVTPSTSATDQTVVDVYVNGTWRGTSNAPILSHGFEHVEVLLTGCCLKVGDLVQATQTVHGVVSGLSPGVRVVSHVRTSCLTQHYTKERTGWFAYETKLSPANTDWSTFSQKIQLPVDGKVYAQPLYMHHQYFPTLPQQAHNVLFLATENDSVYAYDADLLGVKVNGVYQGVKLWQRSLLKDGQRALVPSDLSPDFTDIVPTIGISSTPVIDCGCHTVCGCDGGSGCGTECGCNPACKTGTMYVVAKSIGIVDGVAHLFLHALDVITGMERPNSPVEITGKVAGTGGTSAVGGNDGKGNVIFVPKLHNQRPGLLLLNGKIYIAFGSHADIDRTNYHGWVMSYDTETLEQKDIFCTTPDNGGQRIPTPLPSDGDPSIYGAGSVWQSGMGIASDGQAIYFNIANGALNRVTLDDNQMRITLNSTGRDFGSSVLKLSSTLQPLSFFTPANVETIDFKDLDLGSGGVLVLPDPQSGSHANLLAACGKDATIYLLDRNALGEFGGKGYPLPTAFPANPGDNPNAVSTLALSQAQGSGVFFLGSPAFFRGSFGSFLLYAVDGAPIVAVSVANGTLAQMGTTFERFPLGGTIPIVSSNENDSKSGLVWAIARRDSPDDGNHTLILRAYDANALCSGSQGVVSYIPDSAAKIGIWTKGIALIEPTVINGKTYAACGDHIGVFF